MRLGVVDDPYVRGLAAAVLRSLRAAGVPAFLEGIRLDPLQGRRPDESGSLEEPLREALLSRQVDALVHPRALLPADLGADLSIAATPERVEPRDVLLADARGPRSLGRAEPGTRIGVDHPRRRGLLAAFHPALVPVSLPAPTSDPEKLLEDGDVDAVVTSSARVRALGLEDLVAELIGSESWLSGPGEGATAVVTRADDPRSTAAAAGISHPATAAAVTAELALRNALGAGPGDPVAALGIPYAGSLRLKGLVVHADGSRAVVAARTGSLDDPGGLGREVAAMLLERGAELVLRGPGAGDRRGVVA